MSIEDISKHFPWNNYIIAPKAEGTRCLFVIRNQSLYIITERDVKVYTDINNQNIVIEAEILEDIIYCYDIHLYMD